MYSESVRKDIQRLEHRVTVLVNQCSTRVSLQKVHHRQNHNPLRRLSPLASMMMLQQSLLHQYKHHRIDHCKKSTSAGSILVVLSSTDQTDFATSSVVSIDPNNMVFNQLAKKRFEREEGFQGQRCFHENLVFSWLVNTDL
jgi:hypothetical protein